MNSTDGVFLRAWIRLLAYGTIGCTVLYAALLFQPSGWIVLTDPVSPRAIADGAILGCLLVLQSFIILSTYAAARATLTARTPIPLKPVPGLRVAFVTTRAPGEPVDIAVKTLRAATAITYKSGHVDVWLLDETDSTELRDTCASLGVRYFTRANVPEWNQTSLHYRGAWRLFERLGILRRLAYDPRYAARTKHGNFNAWLAYLERGKINYDILAGVDTDQVPHQNYLLRLLGYFHDPDIAYVVGPQVYGNYVAGPAGLVTRWCESQASFFQSTIQRAANASFSAMLVGTNYALRMDALNQAGGFRPCITEDMATGLAIHANRNPRTGQPWKSVYTPDVLAIGEGPNSWGAYFAQQWRWAAGTFDVWRRLLWTVMPRYRPARAWHYGLILCFYPVVALTWLLAALSGALYLLFGASAVDVPYTSVLSLFLVCTVLQVSLYFWNRRFNVSPHEPRGSLGVAGMAMTALTGPIYAAALISVLSGKKARFTVTKKGGGDERDSLVAFRLPLRWAVVMAGLLAYGIANGRENLAMLSWAVTVILLALAPVLIGYRPRFRHYKQVALAARETVS